MASAQQGLATLICLGLASAIPIAMICLGALHANNCPMEPWIPKFLVVAGAAGLIGIMFTMFLADFQRRRNADLVKVFSFLVSIVALFNFCWNIAGSVWTFSKWSNWDKVKASPKLGCHKETYYFTFVILILFWITFPCQVVSTFTRFKQAREENDGETQTLDP